MNPSEIYGTKLYEGKAKILYAKPDGSVVHYFKDSATAFNGQKKAELTGKGSINARMSALLFPYLQKKGIPTHFIEAVDDRSFRTKKVSIVPAEVVVRNYAAGSFVKRYGVAKGKVFESPLVEFFLKDDALGDPLITEETLQMAFSISSEHLEQMKKLALQVNAALKDLFSSIDFTLADFKLEFGLDSENKIILADEISPDTCRLWDAKTGESFDKDRFRFDLGDLMQGYEIVFERLSKRMAL